VVGVASVRMLNLTYAIWDGDLSVRLLGDLVRVIRGYRLFVSCL